MLMPRGMEEKAPDKEVIEARNKAIQLMLMNQHLDEITSKTIVIDMDGVICTNEGHYQERTPIPGAIETINKLAEKYIITIHTGRHQNLYMITKEWLASHGVMHHNLIMAKPPAIAYIDDKGRKFEGWDKIQKEFLG